jgi:DMSO/TMAO reductase YedYZ molybdopterin-dependent catalytic subunit
VSLDVLLERVQLDPRAAFAIARSDGGYTTNLPIPDILNGQSFIAWEYDGKPLHPAHGGPVRMVVPGLYFWKSAKWIRGIRFLEHDQPGFWESLGYNNHGDPWKEERYQGDCGGQGWRARCRGRSPRSRTSGLTRRASRASPSRCRSSSCTSRASITTAG